MDHSPAQFQGFGGDFVQENGKREAKNEARIAQRKKRGRMDDSDDAYRSL
jgi:hypothetical protein